MKFTREFLFEQVLDNENNIQVQNEIVDTWRWGSVHECIFKHEDKLFSWSYRTQPEEGIQEWGDEFECPEVEAYEKTITAYRIKS